MYIEQSMISFTNEDSKVFTDRRLASWSTSGVEHLFDLICSTALQFFVWSTFQLDMKVLAFSADFSYRKRSDTGVLRLFLDQNCL